MKKALSIVSIAVTQVTFALAQLTAPSVVTQQASNGQGLLNLVGLASTIANKLVPLFVILAVLSFFWFLITFIWKGKDDVKEQEKSKIGMVYSVIAIFVMVSIWGIVALIGSVFGVGQGGGIAVPYVPS
jgi:flagellar basal body-associated protein FliL